jgi:1-acyl-sn-glycerol-3-phosphate acyltransferase
MKKQLYKFIFFKLMGWKIVGIENAEVKKCVMMVMPHTSNHDFYLGIFTRGISGLEMNWVGKKELFKFPFGYYFRSVGGEPLDRSGGLNKVDSIAAIFDRKDVFRLAVAPEGTRKKVKEIKSQFTNIYQMQRNICWLSRVVRFQYKISEIPQSYVCKVNHRFY